MRSVQDILKRENVHTIIAVFGIQNGGQFKCPLTYLIVDDADLHYAISEDDKDNMQATFPLLERLGVEPNAWGLSLSKPQWANYRAIPFQKGFVNNECFEEHLLEQYYDRNDGASWETLYTSSLHQQKAL